MYAFVAWNANFDFINIVHSFVYKNNSLREMIVFHFKDEAIIICQF